MEKVIKTNNVDETLELAKKLAVSLNKGDIITLSGELGSGKTTFTKGLAKGLNIEEEIISPTFNILKCYFNGKLPLYHIDAYRLENQNIEIGLEEFIEGDGVAIIEWPIFIKPLLNSMHLEITINQIDENSREIIFVAPNKHYESILNTL